ncbi:MAG: sigma-70 family RNA polymerase sigma factor, partial [bacterium]
YISDDEESTSPYEILKKDEILEILNKCFLSLDSLSRKILILRFGIDGQNPKTLNEIGLMFGLTKERIRQIELKAVSMLKKSLKD